MESKLREIVRSVIRENFIKEMSHNDVNYKAVMRFYHTGSPSAKKAISLYCCGKPNATVQQIERELGDMGYREITDLVNHFKIKKEYVDKKGVEHVGAALPQTQEEKPEDEKLHNV